MQGECDPDHPILKEWWEQTRKCSKAKPDDDPIERDEAWDRALKKIAGWKAPGPDGIEAVWWRNFRSLGKELKEMFWEMLDGGGGPCQSG